MRHTVPGCWPVRLRNPVEPKPIASVFVGGGLAHAHACRGRARGTLLPVISRFFLATAEPTRRNRTVTGDAGCCCHETPLSRPPLLIDSHHRFAHPAVGAARRYATRRAANAVRRRAENRTRTS